MAITNLNHFKTVLNIITFIYAIIGVHGKPVLFWKGIADFKFPAFYFMHANCPNGDWNQSSFRRFR